MYHFEYVVSEHKLFGYIKIEEPYINWTQTVTTEICEGFKTRGYSNISIEIEFNPDSLCYDKKRTILTVR